MLRASEHGRVGRRADSVGFARRSESEQAGKRSREGSCGYERLIYCRDARSERTEEARKGPPTQKVLSVIGATYRAEEIGDERRYTVSISSRLPRGFGKRDHSSR